MTNGKIEMNATYCKTCESVCLHEKEIRTDKCYACGELKQDKFTVNKIEIDITEYYGQFYGINKEDIEGVKYCTTLRKVTDGYLNMMGLAKCDCGSSHPVEQQVFMFMEDEDYDNNKYPVFFMNADFKEITDREYDELMKWDQEEEFRNVKVKRNGFEHSVGIHTVYDNIKLQQLVEDFINGRSTLTEEELETEIGYSEEFKVISEAQRLELNLKVLRNN